MSESPGSGQQPAQVGAASWWTYARKFLSGFGLTLIVALTITVGIFGWRSYRSNANDARDRRFHRELDSLLAQIRETRENPSPDFNVIREKAKEVGPSISMALKADASVDFPARQLMLFAARDDLPRLMQENLATVSEAEVAIARKLIEAAAFLKIPPPSFQTQDPQVTAALAEIERLGGVITRDPSRPIQPVTAIVMKGDQFHDGHLDHLPNVASLEIKSAEITDAGLQKLRRIRSLTTCWLHCPKVTDAGIASLAALPALSEVFLNDCPEVTDRGLLELKRAQRLVLFGSNFTDQTLTVLKAFPNLQQLTLRSDLLTDDGVGALTDLPRLNTLDLSHCHHLTDAALLRISEIENLETLGIRGSNITDAGLESVGKLPRLTELIISACEDRMPEGLQITDAGLTHIQNLRGLKTLSIQACPGITDASLSVLQSLTSLQFLQLKETGITQEGHQRIVAKLPNTEVNFVWSPTSPLDAKPTSDPGNDLPPDQLAASCQGWPVPDTKASLGGEFTVEQLENEYRMSREATDTKYNGKLIEISGLVSIVGKNLEGDPFIWLSTTDRGFEINCVLRSESDLLGVVEGEMCHLRGVYCVSVLPTFIHCTVKSTTENSIADAVENSTAIGGSNRQVPDVTLTAEQLESEVDADAQEANRKYTGKVIQVTGRITRVSNVMFGAIAYRMGPLLSTQYYLRTGHPWYCARPGQTVTVVGKWYPLYPCLVNCEVISVTGTPNPILTAVELGESLESDLARFRKWFHLKQLIVTGEVIEKSLPKPGAFLGEVVITLQSTENTSIVCEMEADEARAAESVRIGDTVTITGWNTKETPTDSIFLVQGLFWRGK